MPRVTGRKLFIIALNLFATAITLYAGLQENPFIVFVLGRYDRLRGRFRTDSINYDLAITTLQDVSTMPNLKYVGDHYRFYSTPSRSFDSMGEDQNTCMALGTMSAVDYVIRYKDFWGVGPRRLLKVFSSFSAPGCQVINLKPNWVYDTCIEELHQGNETACYQYIHDNFYALKSKRSIQVKNAHVDGMRGAPYLYCHDRPYESFYYITDTLMVVKYWSGMDDIIYLRSSQCFAWPIAGGDMNAVNLTRLYQGSAVNEHSNAVYGVNDIGWFSAIVSTLYSLVSITLIWKGIIATITYSSTVNYVPKALRFVQELHFFKYFVPFMSVAVAFPSVDTAVIRFKGARFFASDIWMNHWLYISLSMLDAVSNFRPTYMLFQYGSFMLVNKMAFENFIFVSASVGRMTWAICFVHTVVYRSLKLFVRGARKSIRPRTFHRINRALDAWALFSTYKVYSILTFLILFVVYRSQGTTTFMVRDEPSKVPVYGGEPYLPKFWRSELVCDTILLFPTVLFLSSLFTIAIMQTKYRYVVDNSLVKLIQRRYFVVGWDSLVIMDALGIDPYNSDRISNGVAIAHSSLGTMLKCLYSSSPSGLVDLAGDYVLQGGDKETKAYRYTLKQAMSLGLYKRHDSYFAGSDTGSLSAEPLSSVRDRGSDGGDDENAKARSNVSLFDKKLQVVSANMLSPIFIVETEHKGRVVKVNEGSISMFEVEEALAELQILDIKHLLGNTRRLAIV